MTEAEKDRVAAMVLAVVQEALRISRGETTDLFVHPKDRQFVEKRRAS